MKLLLNLLILMFLPLFQMDTGDDLRTEIWLRYPVSQFGYGEAGQFDADLTYEPPIPLALKFGDEAEFILVPDLISSFLQRYSERPGEIRLGRSGPDEYRFVDGEEGESGTIVLRLTFENEVAQGSESIEYVMGGSSQTFLLAPAGNPDPREVDGQRCNGGPRIRLHIGGQAATGMASGEVWLASGVIENSASIFTNAGVVNVIAGPLCVGTVAWWQVSLTDDPASVAWTPEMEADYGSYILGPRSGATTSAPMICDAAPASRLSVGAFVAIAEESTPQFLHATPALSGATLTEIPDEAFYKILGGPVCADGLRWWMIAHDGDSGWVAEGQGETYWLEPAHQVIFSDHLQDLTVGG